MWPFEIAKHDFFGFVILIWIDFHIVSFVFFPPLSLCGSLMMITFVVVIIIVMERRRRKSTSSPNDGVNWKN